jgi:hypothetical protein
MSGIGTLHRASRAELRGPHSVVTEIIERDRIADRVKGVTSVASGSKSAIPPASRCRGSAARIRIGEPPAVRADDDSPRDNAQEQ